jgi:D-alanyl-lipoteichoic acid acyltransferase DltB (MBOAT superfamily)
VNYNSWIFWALFLVVIAPYWFLNHRRQNTLLLVASYVFYGFWDYRFLFLILISTAIDFIGGLGVVGRPLARRALLKLGALIVGSSLLLCSNIRYGELWSALVAGDVEGAHAALPHRLADFAVPLGAAAATLVYGALLPWLFSRPEAQRRKYFLTISMVANLAILGFFKYCDFFIGSAEQLLHSLGFQQTHSYVLGILLPAGISFYTFQAMSYTIDIYRGEVEPTEDFQDFALFVCFFPHLVAGPIMRAHTLLPQVVNPRALRRGDFEEGLVLVVLGLFKKIVVADNMAPIANAVFYPFVEGNGAGLTGPEILVGLYAFAFQIYGDFSGYSSIARGISKWLGFDLVVNFHLPYLAVSPSDFWRRWHISLSSWLRDYLYVPLGGNRGGKLATYRNLMITMLLGGLWHGAAWTFVAWGLYQGLVLCLFRVLGVRETVSRQGPWGEVRWLGRVVLMFQLTCLGWLLFRADSLSTAGLMAIRMVTDFHVTGMAVTPLLLVAFYCLPLFLLEWWLDGENRLAPLLRAPAPLRGAVYVYALSMLVFFPADRAQEFIYFQF